MSAEKAKELGVKPMARIYGYASGGVEPSLMGWGLYLLLVRYWLKPGLP